MCDRDLSDNRHRAGLSLLVDRPLVCASADALPFRDGSIDFVIVSHLAEHIEDPDPFCEEIARVACAGYIETPSPIADYLLDEEYHIWRVGSRRGVLEFHDKPKKADWIASMCDRFYAMFYAAQPSCEKRTYSLPSNIVGRIVKIVIRSVGGLLNRSGVMHTRYIFTPMKPLRWRIVVSR